MSFRLVFAVVLTFTLPCLLSAQNTRRLQPGAQQPLQQTEIRGTVQDMGRNGLLVAEGGKTWQVAWSLNNTKVHVTGTLSPNQLKTGMLAELTAEFDARGVIQKKVDSLTITSLSREKPCGIFPAGGEPPPVDAAAPGKRPAGKAGSRAKAGTYRVVGRLTVNRNGSMSIQAPNNRAQFTLASDATIKVDMTDFSAVARGNPITIKGHISPNRPGYVQAAEITVELDAGAGAPPAGVKRPAGVPKDAKKPDDQAPAEN